MASRTRTSRVRSVETSIVVDKHWAGFAVGFGLEKQKECRTSKLGPEIYQECARQTTYAPKGNFFGSEVAFDSNLFQERVQELTNWWLTSVLLFQAQPWDLVSPAMPFTGGEKQNHT